MRIDPAALQRAGDLDAPDREPDAGRAGAVPASLASALDPVTLELEIVRQARKQALREGMEADATLGRIEYELRHRASIRKRGAQPRALLEAKAGPLERYTRIPHDPDRLRIATIALDRA